MTFILPNALYIKYKKNSDVFIFGHMLDRNLKRPYIFKSWKILDSSLITTFLGYILIFILFLFQNI